MVATKKTTKKEIKKEKTKKKASSAIKKAKKIKASSPEKKKEKPSRYFKAVGRRKTATARIRIFPLESSKKGSKKEKAILVNDKPLEIYFPNVILQDIVKSPLEITNSLDKFKITALVRGGGINAQAEALRHGISRALVDFNSELRKELKRAGFLKRDPRMRERKKFGLKRARRAPQWSKR